LWSCKAVLFDLYGTLVDITSNEKDASLWEYMASYPPLKELDLPGEKLHSVYLQEAERTFKREKSIHKKPWRDIDILPVWYDTIHRIDPCIGFDDIMSWIIEFRSQSRKSLQSCFGASKALASLKAMGLNIFLICNGQWFFGLKELEETGLKHLIDRFYFSSNMGLAKPETNFFQQILQENNLESSDVVMVGNEWINDIDPATALGIRSIFLTKDADKVGSSSVKILRKLEDIPQWLNKE